MITMVFAFGTDDGSYFTKRHFGDSDRFDLYKIDLKNVNFIKQITNNSEEEKVHADPKKAGSIAKILNRENVQIVVSKHFGPNILRIRKKFVCIKTSCDSIEEMKTIIQHNLDLIETVLIEGENRGYIVQREDLSFNYVQNN